ncbi:hypothetical protein BKD09_18820 [Bradyrhizobium japonicum]|uniref:Uncharacterized protein n=1 Tax=Bradyrhizobium japonicum TaxID=375 RepID=A0A1L3FAQ3_BRAJP|nr:hypothetical protein BKD09_18820 [Bradyrhizobium japonicum]
MSTKTLAHVKGVIFERPAEVVPGSDIPLYIPEDGDFEWLSSFAPRNLQQDTRNDIVADLWVELAGRRVSRVGVRYSPAAALVAGRGPAHHARPAGFLCRFLA